MTISFSGLASGLDTSSWISSLTALKQAKVTSLQQEKTVIETKQSSLNTIKNIFSNFRSLVEKVTDARLNVASMNVFAQRIASSANLNVLTATATTEASEGKYEIKVDKLATNTSATSKYSYNTTIVETTKATNASLLRNMGITTGNIGVCVDGIERRVNITENDTIGSFIQKLGNVGVNASFNEDSGIFTADISLTDIHDLNLTGIVDCLVDKLHLKGVNEGYQTAQMQLENVDTEWNIATTDTQLSLLGVTTAGNNDNVTVNAFDHDYTVTITDNMTIGGFITALKSQNANIDASLSNDGIFTLNNAYITGDGTTGLLAALGLEDGQDAQICEITQASNQLSHNVTTTDIAIATIATKLVDIGTGTTMPENANVIVKNSNNEYTTINLNQNSTLGDLLTAMGNAGLSAQIDNDGIVSISGGTITGGTFNVAEVLGLSSEPYTARVTGNALTETIELFELVNLDTKIVDDLRVKEGYLKVTDSEGVDRYLKIYSGQTIQNLMSDLASMGIDATLDDEGVLSITGGAFETLSDTDVEYLYGNGSIMDDDRYMHGTDLLEKLYGSESIPLNMTSVASTRAKSRALRTTVTNTIMATTATTLGTLGLTQDNYNAVFNVRDENRTINISSTDTIADFMNKLQAAGIGSSFDEDTSRITIENSVISGSENLANILGLTTEVSGKYATSNAVYAHNTILAELTDKLSDFITLPTEKTVAVHDVDGNVIGTVTVTNSSTFESFFADLDEYGITGSIINGQISFTSNNGNYISGAVLGELGISTSTQTMIVTTTVGTTSSSTAAVTHTERELAGYDSKISDFITLPANKTITIKNSDDYDIATVTINGDTTFRQLFEALDNNGIIGTLSEGVISLTSNNGSYATGQVLTEFGMTTPVSYTTTVAVTKASSSALTYTHTEKATSADKISDFITLPDNKVITVKDNDQNTVGTVTIGANTTFDEMFTQLAALDVQGHIEDGVVKLSSSSGNYATGSVLTSLGISVTPTTVTSYVTTTSGTTSTSGLITYGSTDTATVTSTISTYITTLTSNTNLVVKNEAGTAIGTVTVGATTTFQQMFNALDDLGIQASISDGVVTMTSNNGSYVTGDFLAKLGMSAVTSTTVITTVTGDVQTSTAVVSYSTTTTAGTSSKISDYVTLTDSNRTITVKDTTNTAVGSIVVNANTTFDDLFTQLASYDIQASMNNGVITINKGDENYVTGAVLTSLGITTTTTTVQETVGSTSTSALIKYASTDTATVTSTIKTYVTDLADNTKLTVKDEIGNAIGTVTIGTTTTFQQMFNALDDLGIQASISDGVVTMTSNNGSYVTGDFLTKLGMSAVTTTTTYTTTIGNTQTSSAAVTYKSTTPVTQTSTAAMQATRVAQMSDQISVFTGTLTGDAAKIVVKNADNSAATTITTSGKTFGQVCDELTDAGVTATMDGGVISLSSTVGRYIEDLAASNGVLSKLGISSVAAGNESVTVAKTMTSSAQVKWNETQYATLDTKLVDCNAAYSGKVVAVVDSTTGRTVSSTMTTDGNTTFRSLFNFLSNRGIQGSLSDGVVTLTSNMDGYYVEGLSALGLGTTDVSDPIYVGKTLTSSTTVTHTVSHKAGYADKLSDTVTGFAGANKTITVTTMDGTSSTFTVDNNTTFDQLFAALDAKGIQGTINDGVVMLTSSNGSYATGAVLSAMGIGTTDTTVTLGWTTTYSTTYATHTISITAGTVETGSVMNGTTSATYTEYAQIGDKISSYISSANGKVMTVTDDFGVTVGSVTIDNNTTFSTLFQNLSTLGVQGTIEDGRVMITSNNGSYVSGTLADALGIGTVNRTVIVGSTIVSGTGTATVTVTTTTTTGATMSSASALTYSRYANINDTIKSGFAADTWNGFNKTITVTKDDGTSAGTVTVTDGMTYKQLFEALDDKGIQGTMEDGVVMLTSNNGSYATGAVLTGLGISTTTYTAVVGSTVVPVDVTGNTSGSVTVSITETVTSNTNTNRLKINSYMNADAKMNELNSSFGTSANVVVQNGDSTITITAEANDSVNDVLTALAGAGVTGTISSGGVLTLQFEEGAYISSMDDALKNALGLGAVTFGTTTTTHTMTNTVTVDVPVTVTTTATGTEATITVVTGYTTATVSVTTESITGYTTTVITVPSETPTTIVMASVSTGTTDVVTTTTVNYTATVQQMMMSATPLTYTHGSNVTTGAAVNSGSAVIVDRTVNSSTTFTHDRIEIKNGDNQLQYLDGFCDNNKVINIYRVENGLVTGSYSHTFAATNTLHDVSDWIRNNTPVTSFYEDGGIHLSYSGSGSVYLSGGIIYSMVGSYGDFGAYVYYGNHNYHYVQLSGSYLSGTLNHYPRTRIDWDTDFSLSAYMGYNPSGNIAYYDNVSQSTKYISITGSDTKSSFISKLNNAGIDCSFYSSGNTRGITLTQDTNNNYILYNSSDTVGKSCLNALMSSSPSAYYSSLQYGTLNPDMTFAQLGMSGSEVVSVNVGGTTHTVTISDTDKVDELMTFLAGCNIATRIEGGVFYIDASDEAYISGIGSGIRTALDLPSAGYTSTATVYRTINRSGTTQFQQLGAGSDNYIKVFNAATGTEETFNVSMYQDINYVVSQLQARGISAEYEDGVFKIYGGTDSYITYLGSLSYLGISGTTYSTVPRSMTVPVTVTTQTTGVTYTTVTVDNSHTTPITFTLSVPQTGTSTYTTEIEVPTTGTVTINNPTIDYTTTATGTGTVTITTVTTTGTSVTGGTMSYDRAVQMSDAVNSTKNLGGVTGKTIVVKDYAGDSTASFTINTTTSFDTLFSILSNYDIQATMEDGRIMITSTNGHYIDTSSGSLFGALGSTTNQTSSIYSTVVPVNTSGSMSGSVTVTITNTVTSNTVSNQMNNLSAGIVGSTKLSDLKSDIGTTTITVNNQGVTRYVTLEASDTIDDMLSALGGVGISGIITGGQVVLQSSTGNRITDMSANLRTALGLSVGTYTTETTTHITESTVNTTAEVIIKNTITSNKTTAIQSKASSAIGSCTLADIGITTNQSMTVALSTAGDPIYHTITFNTNDTINDMLTTLAGYGVSGNLDTDGKLHLDFDTGTYITGVSDGLKSKFGLANASGHSTTTMYSAYTRTVTVISDITGTDNLVTSVLTSNTASSAQNTSYTTNLTGYSKLSDLGISSGTITVNNNGTNHTIDMANFANGTVDDVLTALAGYGISGSAFNGSITLAPSSDAYVSGISSTLAGIFKLPSDNTGNALYTATTQTLHGNSISSSMTHVVNTTMTDTTTLASIGANADSNDTRKIVLSNGTTLTYGKTDTVGDVINGLRANGMDADIHNGKLTVTSNNGNYIVSVADGLKNALKISSGADGSYVVHRNERFNTNSNVQQTVRTATSSSTLNDIYKAKNGGTALTDTTMTININGVDNTLTVKKDWSIEDLTNQLAAYGVAGSFDASTGKYTLSCASGTYIKTIDAKLANALNMTSTSSSYYSSSDINMTTDTKMSQIGVTSNQNITVVTNGTTHVVTVKSSDTVDDMLTTLSGYGISGSVTNGVLTLNATPDCYITGVDSTLAQKLKINGQTLNHTTTRTETTGYNTNSNIINRGTTLTVSGSATFAELSMAANGTITVVHNGTQSTVTVETGDTVDDMLTTLAGL